MDLVDLCCMRDEHGASLKLSKLVHGYGSYFFAFALALQPLWPAMVAAAVVAALRNYNWHCSGSACAGLHPTLGAAILCEYLIVL